MKIRKVRAEFFHADRQQDRETKGRTDRYAVYVILRKRFKRLLSHNFAYLEVITRRHSTKRHKNLYSVIYTSQYIFFEHKCSRMRWVAHVAYLGGKEYPVYRVCLAGLAEKYNFADPN
jgi:hypothetical protein